VMITIETSFARKWRMLWIERHFILVIKAFTSPNLVPWKLRNRWLNCIEYTHTMSFRYSHIYRE
ncbi:hypothetical protein glysoja_021386, partial [Glycine soja]